ncbi:hypothetical protein SLEP1_g5420 [Rubroshorea leprosula]|uniref:Uncharacterized protein n=1 Tax=Rubroshorea leprosula TaxID=152421 RepID=A0AAV5HXQ3_9ROSI|nr:hypothetical protein SLEP1_g5420 [Rubroshorea leprosula]
MAALRFDVADRFKFILIPPFPPASQPSGPSLQELLPRPRAPSPLIIPHYLESSTMEGPTLPSTYHQVSIIVLTGKRSSVQHG